MRSAAFFKGYNFGFHQKNDFLGPGPEFPRNWSNDVRKIIEKCPGGALGPNKSIFSGTFFDQFREHSGPGPKMLTFSMKIKVVALEKCCRTHLKINPGDLFLTISWMSKFSSFWGLPWGTLPWLGWLACCALPRLGLPCLDLF